MQFYIQRLEQFFHRYMPDKQRPVIWFWFEQVVQRFKIITRSLNPVIFYILKTDVVCFLIFQNYIRPVLSFFRPFDFCRAGMSHFGFSLKNNKLMCGSVYLVNFNVIWQRNPKSVIHWSQLWRPSKVQPLCNNRWYRSNSIILALFKNLVCRLFVCAL